MISLGIYGYKKYQKRRAKKKLNQNIGEAPSVTDRSAEFAQSHASLSGRPEIACAVNYAEKCSSLYSGTVSEPNSTVSNRSLEYAPGSALSSTSSEYQQYVERQSNSYVNDKPDQPPTYQAAPRLPPGQPAGIWIFVPAGGQIPFANGLPANPLPPNPLLASPQFASVPHAIELPANLPPAAFAKSTTNELPAHVPTTAEGKAVTTKHRETSRFELAADETLSPSKESRRSENDEESRKGVEMKRSELA